MLQCVVGTFKSLNKLCGIANHWDEMAQFVPLVLFGSEATICSSGPSEPDCSFDAFRSRMVSCVRSMMSQQMHGQHVAFCVLPAEIRLQRMTNQEVRLLPGHAYERRLKTREKYAG